MGSKGKAIFLLPTATSPELGQGKWGIGQAAVMVVRTKKIVIGTISNNIWSVAGDGDRPNVNQLQHEERLVFAQLARYNRQMGGFGG
ncbi:hypothetical protein [Synechocystis salina]|uniref:hypothetical protein n=1 Tax=Synechocystis salina TaxID=945780 RepID=UPI001882A4AC|nr:hypothetical protein [Synechocystis salina]